jgi:hypothetical protein
MNEGPVVRRRKHRHKGLTDWLQILSKHSWALVPIEDCQVKCQLNLSFR